MFSVGKERVPLHVLCGQLWEILYDREVICIVTGSKEKAKALVDRLNLLIKK